MKGLIKRITNWEAWPFWLIYLPVFPVWGWYSLRAGSLWFFTPSNPKLTFGGMEGEPKKEMYDLLPRELYPLTVNAVPGENFETVLNRAQVAGIKFPLVVKPEVGGKGILFRKFDHAADLQRYHEEVPVEYIIQDLIPYSIEVSAFHIRYPGNPKGFVTGFLQKIPLQVSGDGVHTLTELIDAHPKAEKYRSGFADRVRGRENEIIPAGSTFMLSYAGNHNRGAQFIDLKEHICPRLVSMFDEWSLRIDDFFYGRYDIMCASIEDLKQRKNFLILEYNGCGAEPNHFYDTGYTYGQALREILKHWKYLFEISMINAKKGVKPWPYNKGRRFLRDTKRMYRVMEAADKSMP